MSQWHFEAAARDDCVRKLFADFGNRSDRLNCLIVGYAFCWRVPTDVRKTGQRLWADQGAIYVSPEASVCVGHDGTKILGSTTVGSCRFLSDSVGLFVAVIPAASRFSAGAVRAIQQGKFNGMSLGLDFQVRPRVRFAGIQDIHNATANEVSLVSQPAIDATCCRVLDDSRLDAAVAIEHDVALEAMEQELRASDNAYTPSWCATLNNIIRSRASARLAAI